MDVAEARLLREVESSAAPVVCHLAFEGSPLDDEMDEHLARLAHLHLGTRFLRAPITLRSTLHLRLRTPPGPGAPPALPACLIAGNRSSLQQTANLAAFFCSRNRCALLLCLMPACHFHCRAAMLP
jgi:hypothetical protein